MHHHMESLKKVLVVVVAVLVAVGEAQYCNMSAEGLRACQPAVSQTNPTAPSVACCSALATANLPCFCNMMKGFSNNNAFGVSIERAKQIPGLCNPARPANCA